MGGGVEYGITPNLSAKAEYLYAHLEPTDYFVNLGCTGICSAGANVNLVRLGLNWRFSNASAADMPVKALSYKAPPAGATYNWSGLYFGVNGGYGMGQTTGDWFGLRGGNFDIEGALFGGQIGLNYQFPASPFSHRRRSRLGLVGHKRLEHLGSGPGVTLTNNEAIKDLGTVRGRVGYAWDRILIYGTGGVAWSHKAPVDFTCTGPCVPSAANDSHSLNGYTVGGGVEYGITPNLSAKAEYLYAHLEPTDYFVSLGCTGICSVGANVNLVRLGLNWRFNSMP